MNPTLLVGDHILVDKFAKNLNKIKRGDIIVFVFPPNPRKDFVKRVIGLPEELIEIRDKALYINIDISTSGGGKMPVTYQINHETGFIETRCTGEVTFDEVMGHFEQLEAEPSLPRRLDVLLDLAETTTLPGSNQLLEVTQAVDRLKARVQWGACAIVAGHDALFGMSRMFEVFAEGLFVRISVFRGREDAKRWLACPPSPST